MSGFEWRQIPAGLDVARWLTQGNSPTVLVVVHTIALGQPMLDIVRLLESDPRIKVAFTTAPDAISGAVESFLRDRGAVLVPRQQARDYKFGLAIAANYGAIHQVNAPLIVVPAAADESESAICMSGRRSAGSWITCRPDRQRRVHDGALIPAAIALAHEAEFAQIARSHPELVPVARLVGDSNFDRVLASLPLRDFYRRALGVGSHQKLVVIASDCGQRSLFCQQRELMSQLLSELPAESFRVLAVLGRGGWASRGSPGLLDCLRRGLSVMPSDADWRAPLVAADWIVDDNGIGPYGAITGVPVLLSGRSDDYLNPVPGAVELANVAPRLSSHYSISAQLRKATEEYECDRYGSVIERITSEPGRFNRNMRSLMYRLLHLQQPATIPATDPVPPPIRIE